MGSELSEEQLLADLRALGIDADSYLSDYDRIEQFVRETAMAEHRAVTVAEVADHFSMPPVDASKKLSALKQHGRLHWLRRGLYIPAGVAK